MESRLVFRGYSKVSDGGCQEHILSNDSTKLFLIPIKEKKMVQTVEECLPTADF